VSPLELAERLRAAHPDADPLEVGLDQIELWAEALRVGPASDTLLSAAVAAWSELVT